MMTELVKITIRAMEKVEQEEQKSGKWIPIPYEIDYGSDAECSLCHGRFIDAIDYKYCPDCGAKMKKEVF